MADIVRKLKRASNETTAFNANQQLCADAAAEIERLRAALDPMRLTDIIGSRWLSSPNENSLLAETVQRIRAGIDEQ